MFMSIPPEPLDPLQAWLEATRAVGDVPPPAAPRAVQDDEAGAATPRRASRGVIRAAALACVVALALGIASRRPLGAVPAAAPVPSPTALSTAAALPPPAAPSTGTPPVAMAPAEAPTAAQAAAAVTAVRLATAPDRYVDTAVAETASPAGAAVIVTVRAVVLNQVGDGWADPHTARYAVAVSAQPPAVAYAPPWPLVADTPSAPQLSWQAAPTLQAAAQAALTAAGYRRSSDVRVRRSDTLPDIVSALCRAVAPGESIPRHHEVWLTPDAAHVLGMTADPPIPVPGETP
jgi:hypothetical protein